MATSPGRGAAASRRRWRALDGLGALAICVATLALSNGRVVDATSIYSVCLVQVKSCRFSLQLQLAPSSGRCVPAAAGRRSWAISRC